MIIDCHGALHDSSERSAGLRR